MGMGLVVFRILAVHLLLPIQFVSVVATKVEPYHHQAVKDAKTQYNLGRRTKRIIRQTDNNVGSAEVHFGSSINEEDVRQLIVGGEEVSEGSYPYYVEVGGCGGSLIAPDLVLTVAHCGNFTGKTIVVGAYHHEDNTTEGSQHVQVVNWAPNPNFSKVSMTSDMALLKIDPPVYQNNTSITLGLPVVEEIANAETLTIIGLGTLEADADNISHISTLRDVDVLAIPTDMCNSSGFYSGRVDDTMFCAGYLDGGKDACVGDSGGPIVRKVGNEHTQLGVVSWGLGCGAPLRPGVYSRIHDKLGWIKQVACTQWGSVSAICDGWSDDSTNSPILPTSPTLPPSPDTTPANPPPPTPGPTPASDSGVARNKVATISLFVAVLMVLVLLCIRRGRQSQDAQEPAVLYSPVANVELDEDSYDNDVEMVQSSL